ncbi:short-chain dehydrogenase [Lactarius akahatsu]|uniref:Short-chain dehydrogenase n=1 Tax=Lactarius akahatsu TaxID=416441 RepID=A0AAD4LN60_9AGAM|nr:short-chain dehydrogenase [Lactarius akahatsu]
MAVVIVTGASRGIGLAATSFLLEAFNATVVAISRTRTPELDALTTAHPGSLQAVQCDMPPAFTAAIQSVLAKHGHLDGLILNAGAIEPLVPVASADTPLDAWRTHFEINVYSLITALKAAVPSLRDSPKGGRVVFVSSGAAILGIAGWGPYSASKAAMNSLNRLDYYWRLRHWHEEEKGKIVSIAVRPGKVDTNMQGEIRESGGLHMAHDVHQSFVREKREGLLLKPEQPGYVIAALSLHAPESLSGEFVNWDDERCREFRRPS